MIETTKGLKLPESSEFVKVKENISDNFQKTETFITNNDGAEVGYNGITHIQDVGEKVAGKLYYDKLQPGLFYCKANTSINYNSADYFEDYSNYSNGNKLQNLDIERFITYAGKSILSIFPNGTKVYRTPLPYSINTVVNTVDLSSIFEEIQCVVASVNSLASEGSGSFYIVETRVQDKNKLQYKALKFADGVISAAPNNLKIGFEITGI